jgi:hypothetical protein
VVRNPGDRIIPGRSIHDWVNSYQNIEKAATQEEESHAATATIAFAIAIIILQVTTSDNEGCSEFMAI